MATAPGKHKIHQNEIFPVFTVFCLRRSGHSAEALILLSSELDVAERPGLLLCLLQGPGLLPSDWALCLLLLSVTAWLLLRLRLPAHPAQGRSDPGHRGGGPGERRGQRGQ